MALRQQSPTAAFAFHQDTHAAIAIRRPFVHDGANDRQKNCVVSSGIGLPLFANAFMMAVWRCGSPTVFLRHSDQGCQYTSEHFHRLLAEQGITCSMSRAGDVWDNSAVESFISSLKTERTTRKDYRSREESGQMCSITSIAFTVRHAGIRRSGTSARYNSSWLKKLKGGATDPEAAHLETASIAAACSGVGRVLRLSLKKRRCPDCRPRITCASRSTAAKAWRHSPCS